MPRRSTIANLVRGLRGLLVREDRPRRVPPAAKSSPATRAAPRESRPAPFPAQPDRQGASAESLSRTIQIARPAKDGGERPGEDPSRGGPQRPKAETLPLPRRKPMSDDDVPARIRDLLAARIQSLSSLPTVMTNLVACLQDPETPPRDVTRLASTDPAVAAEILHTVNSSFFGLREKVKELNHAILMLGYNQVKFLVARLGVDSSLGAADRAEHRMKLASIWRHSHLASEAVSLLVRHYAGGAGGDASTAALLHDLGKLVILDLPPRDDLEENRVFRAAALTLEERVFVEEDYYGINHCLVGERIAARLQLPPLVRLVISRHHHPLDGPEVAAMPQEAGRALVLVKVADALAHEFAVRLGSEPEIPAGAGIADAERAFCRRHLRQLPDVPALLEEFHHPLRKATDFLDSLMPRRDDRRQAQEPGPGPGVPSGASVRGGVASIASGESAGPRTTAPHTVAGRYSLVKKLGDGSIGSVHLCEDTLLGQRFAIKILKPALQQSAPALNAFLNEARVAMRLNHPNIVRVFHLDVRDGVCYILQEYMEGRTLDEVLGECPGNRMQEGQAVRIARSLAAAMAYAHANGVIHRDLSPGNVMMDDRGEVKLLDFGVAACRGLDDRGRGAAQADVAGTPQYMSPEHWDGNESVDPRSDVYSFGAVLYTLLSGSVPFPCDTCEELRGLIRTSRPRPLVAVSSPLRLLVERCLDPNPAARWQDFTTLAAVLEKVQAPPALAGAAPRAGRPAR